MNKENMAWLLSQKTRLTRKEAEDAVDVVFDSITSALSRGEKVQIAGFGAFEVKDRAPRVGRNPKANVPVMIPARKSPVFKPGKSLKEAVNPQN